MSDILSDPDTKLHLEIQAEKAKKKISARSDHKVTVMHDGTTAKIDFFFFLFESLTSTLMGRTISITKDVIEAAKQKKDKNGKNMFNGVIDEVLLVGGSCYMPQVKITVDSALNCDAKLFEPNAAVAKGAAMFAMFEKEYELFVESEDDTSESQDDSDGVGPSPKPPQKKEIINVLSKTYGIGSVIEKKDKSLVDVISNMLFVQDEVPISVTKTFQSVHDGQSEMLLQLFETMKDREDSVAVEGIEYKGKVDIKFGGEPICGLTIDFDGSFPAGYKIQVTVALNAEGIIVVTAKDDRTGKVKSVEAKIKGIRSDEEVKKAAAKFAKMEIDC
jgi:molecular chaperone DnaK (HSP70)